MHNQKSVVFFVLFVLCCFLPVSSIAQVTQKITGNVKNSNNEAIVGATISTNISGNLTGTISDIDGNFKLEVPAGSTIKISSVGYKTYQEKVSSDKSFYPVILEEEIESLEELVVVGYGTQKRSDLTGSISSVKSEDLKDYSSKSLAESLGGMAAGVMVTKGDGSPGSSADIIIRGAGSLNGMSPLYIVDGVPQGTGFDFNVRDVESVEILKDAGSAAIYGSRAAGGVILITTKHGKPGEKTSINANVRSGFRNITTDIKLLDTKDWIRARDVFGTSNTLNVLGAGSIDDLPDTDWMKVMFGTGIEQEYNLSAASSSEKTSFFLSGSYLSEKGVYLDTRSDRFSFRNNLEHKFSDHISIGESLYGSSIKTNPSTSSSIYNHTIPFRTVPVSPVYDQDGNFAKTNDKAGSGPNFAGLEDAFHVFNDNNYALNLQTYLNINFIEGLDLKVTGAGEFSGFSKNTFTEYRDFGPVQVSPQQMNSYAGSMQNLMFNSVLTYQTNIGNHSLKVMTGTESWKLDGYNLGVTAYNFSIPVAQSIALSSAGPTKDAWDNLPIERRSSFFGRVNYSYLNRYLLTANFRADASDRFVGQNRWGYFPSVNLGWKISEEDFIKSFTEGWLSNAKIRASWGILGNDMSVPQFMYQSTWSGTGISHSFDGTSTQQAGYWLAIFGNQDLKWEQINQLDFGLDLSFLANRLAVSYDYYNRQTKDMLYRGDLPLSAGMSYYFSSDDPANTVPVYFNAGLVENQGHEISIGWRETRNDFRYSINTNASFNSNLVKRVGAAPGASPIDEGLDNTWNLLSRTQDGYPMSMFYGYKVIGIFQNQEQVLEYNQRALDTWKLQNPDHTSFDPVTGQPLNLNGQPIGIYYQKQQTSVGDLIFDDNGQGRVTPLSRTFIGNPWPKMTFGLNINLAYKNFDLSAVFQGAFGFDIINLVKPYTQMFSSDNTTADIFKTSLFGAGNTNVTDYPRVGYIDVNGSFIGDGAANKNYSTVSGYLVEKGDYLKLKNFSFGYSLPKQMSQKISVEKARLYVSMQNLFTITGYTGIDPEIGGGVLMRGVDHQNRYLPSRLISFGVDLTF
ncbi:MAG: SusC/RagA family TonB-linked outer membrane protein [Bacteroidales bacterium]|nr:SusC/RagA family TonB-linked outer membrane protein [Bacteroidales bacterium]MCB9012580.1 SusC/RagA family TonB-linked outer membrane protein [Bacteroidales bacterium]